MSKNSSKWFKKIRESYIPVAWQGWLCYLPYIAYLLFTYLYVMYSFGYSVLSLLIIIPNWVVAVLIMSWLASKKS
jgi:hypothetical protein